MPKVPCVCLICQRSFSLHPSHIANGEGKYCSIACSRQRPRREVSCVCLQCQCTFIVKLSAKERGEGLYCSKRCWAQHRTQPLADRFWSSVIKTETCWLWQGRRNNKGYGLITLGHDTTMLVHRLAYELTYGMIMPGLFCLHRCDTPLCCRPDHLWLGSQADNMRDMSQKGRSIGQRHPERMARGERNGAHTHPEKVLRGEQNGQSKLTEANVRAIRRMQASKEMTRKQMAALFGVNKSAIDKVLARQVWKHVD